MTHALHILQSMLGSQAGIAYIGNCDLYKLMRNMASKSPAKSLKPDHCQNNQNEGLDTEMSRSLSWNATKSDLSLALLSLGTPDVKAFIDLIEQRHRVTPESLTTHDPNMLQFISLNFQRLIKLRNGYPRETTEST